MLPSTEHRLGVRAARAQCSGRLPSLVAGLARGGELAWSAGYGNVDGSAPGADTQYRIGSITKTFTAVLVLRLRDEGLLRLDDPVDRHVAGKGIGDRTIGQLLGHAGGVQAETDGPWWERTPGSDWDALSASLGAAAVRHPAGTRFHYSNLGFGVLGEVVARLRGVSWGQALATELLEPLGLSRTTLLPQAPAAAGLAVHPWADLVLPEPAHDAGAMAPAGQLWSTAADLARWAAFLLGDTGGQLAVDTVEEMRRPGATDTGRDAAAYGLGLQTFVVGRRSLAGHGGSMPGFLAQLLLDPAERTGAVVLANATAGLDPDLSVDLLRLARRLEPASPQEWTPLKQPPDQAVLALLGTWYWGPAPFALRLRGDGMLELGALAGTGRRSRFRALADGGWVGLDGYFAGEVLRPFLGTDGAPSYLDIASFIFTRQPYDPAAPVPGGVDPQGWSPQR